MSWFKKQQFESGALLDTRSPEEQAKDFKFEEIVASANPVIWTAKTWGEVRQFPIFNQNGSGSCVAQTMAKLLGVLYWLKNGLYVHFSATHVYQRRSNKPNGGMAGVNALDIAREGVTLEALVPSQAMTDTQMDGIKIEPYKDEVGKIFKIGNYVVLPTADIETVASTIQTTGKAVMVWFYFKIDEWKKETPVIKYSLTPTSSGVARHSVTAVDYLMSGGKKALVIEDSWGVDTGNGGRRIITEDFFNKRNFFAAYPICFKFEEGSTAKPKYTGSTVSLQDVLKFEGFFPTNVESTGNWYSVTDKAVQGFCTKYAIVFQAGRQLWSALDAKLKELYG
ncbi:MAG: hypothetical protein NUV96_00515 [Candidatus Colwellbacteria bacterium]|nr:hypothetical protein [Candidatus Colwellbacteria bacterium]